MTERISRLVGPSRRQFFALLTALVALIPGLSRFGSASGPQKAAAKGRSPLTEADFKPFQEIAKRKGVSIKKVAFREMMTTDQIHLDMDMVEQSLRSAITATDRTGQKDIKTKLEWLLAKGTDAEKVEFVLGSGTYYFPGDVERLAKLSRESGGKATGENCRRVCEPVYYWVCRCIQTRNDQECRETSRIFCQIYCG